MLNLRGSPHFHRIIVCIPRKSLVCVCNHRVCFNRRAYEGPNMANLQCETLVLFLFPRLWKALLESTAKAVVTVSSGKAKRGECVHCGGSQVGSARLYFSASLTLN
jgi:hypothetical protein